MNKENLIDSIFIFKYFKFLKNYKLDINNNLLGLK